MPGRVVAPSFRLTLPRTFREERPLLDKGVRYLARGFSQVAMGFTAENAE